MQNSPGSETPQPPETEAAPSTDELTAELARIEDRYKRALADLDNYRKRAAREIERRTGEAREAVLLDWLQTVDSVERAIRMAPDGPCAEGLGAVLEQMDATLALQGVTRIGTAGDPFDPERHEAIAVEARHDVPDRTVLNVERSGYALGERVIRPAQVVVARAPEHVH